DLPHRSQQRERASIRLLRPPPNPRSTFPAGDGRCARRLSKIANRVGEPWEISSPDRRGYRLRRETFIGPPLGARWLAELRLELRVHRCIGWRIGSTGADPPQVLADLIPAPCMNSSS